MLDRVLNTPLCTVRKTHFKFKNTAFTKVLNWFLTRKTQYQCLFWLYLQDLFHLQFHSVSIIKLSDKDFFSITQNTSVSFKQLSVYQKVANCPCSIASNSCSFQPMNIAANKVSFLFLVNNYCSDNTWTSIYPDSSIESFLS